MTKSQIAVAAMTTTAASLAVAGANAIALVPIGLPTLGEIGLGLLVALLGVAGGLIVRRRK